MTQWGYVEHSQSLNSHTLRYFQFFRLTLWIRLSRKGDTMMDEGGIEVAACSTCQRLVCCDSDRSSSERSLDRQRIYKNGRSSCRPTPLKMSMYDGACIGDEAQELVGGCCSISVTPEVLIP